MALRLPLHKTVVVPSSHASVCRLCKRILADVKAGSFDAEAIFGIHLAIEEALTNAVKHGSKQNLKKHIKVDYSVTSDKFDIMVIDEGGGFNPAEVPDPRLDENLYKAGGRGLLLMRAYMDSVEYNTEGNCVHMVKLKRNAESDRFSKNKASLE